MVRTCLCAHCRQETPLPDYFFVLWAGTRFNCRHCGRENVTTATYEAAPGYALQARTYGFFWGLVRGKGKSRPPAGTLSLQGASRLLNLARERTDAGDLFTAIIYRTRVISAPNLTKNPILYSHRGEDYLELGNAIDAERDYRLAIETARRSAAQNLPLPDDFDPRMVDEWQARLSAIEPLAAEQRAALARRHWAVRWFFDFGNRYAYSEVKTYSACQSLARGMSNVLYAGLLPVRGVYWIAKRDQAGLINTPTRARQAMTARFYRGCVWGFHILKCVAAIGLVALAVALLRG